MFFRSKSAKPAAPPIAKAEPPRPMFSLTDAPPRSDARTPSHQAAVPAPVVAPPVAAADGIEPTATSADELRRAEQSRQFALALGQITSVALQSKRHLAMTLSDFRVRVVPALLNGQFALASRRDERLGVHSPVTAVLWACVSDEIDRRMSRGDGDEIKLERSEWRSGPNVWVVDVFGDATTLPGLLRQLGATQWSGKSVKMFVREPDGSRTVRVVDGAWAAG